MRTDQIVDDARLGEALVRLLAHDLRSPLAPLMLAVSSIEEDHGASADARMLARLAGAQAARAARMIDAVVASVRGPRPGSLAACDLTSVAREALDAFEALGGSGSVVGPPVPVRADAVQLRDAITNLIECSTGEGGTAEVKVVRDDASARVAIVGAEAEACCRALASRAPADWRSALALGAVSVVRAHEGTVVPSYDGVVIVLGAA